MNDVTIAIIFLVSMLLGAAIVFFGVYLSRRFKNPSKGEEKRIRKVLVSILRLTREYRESGDEESARYCEGMARGIFIAQGLRTARPDDETERLLSSGVLSE